MDKPTEIILRAQALCEAKMAFRAVAKKYNLSLCDMAAIASAIQAECYQEAYCELASCISVGHQTEEG